MNQDDIIEKCNEAIESGDKVELLVTAKALPIGFPQGRTFAITPEGTMMKFDPVKVLQFIGG